MLTPKIENLFQFIDGIKSDKVNETNRIKLISFAYDYPKINFHQIINNLNSGSHSFFYWEKPDEDYTILGIDSLDEVQTYGENRTELSRTQIEKWINNYFTNFTSLNISSVPVFMGGMKFSPEGNSTESIWKDFADSDWFIPKLVLLKQNKKYFIVLNFTYQNLPEIELANLFKSRMKLFESLQVENQIFEPESVDESNLYDKNERENWIDKVHSALNQISSGTYKKIVLSRRVSLSISGKPILSEKLHKLSEEYPRCYIFAYGKNESIFFGASPEKLAKISNGWVEADALAGSTPRGQNQSDDDRLAEELLLSKKNLNEQYAVVDFITNSFAEFSDEIVYDEKPIIRKLSNIQHLWTPIKARLKPGHTIFSILKEIHPTPAICGVPWSGALNFIRTTEAYNRGLYAGIIGWFNFEEQGEFAVAIRSGLLKNNKLYAFAGCGIVEGSDPELEFEETELKLKPILSLFPHENVPQS